MKKQKKKTIIAINSHEKPHFLKKKRLCVPWEYHRRTLTVPRFKNKNKKVGASWVRTVRVPYEYQYPRSTRYGYVLQIGVPVLQSRWTI
jgi:hypothetical protein